MVDTKRKPEAAEGRRATRRMLEYVLLAALIHVLCIVAIIQILTFS